MSYTSFKDILKEVVPNFRLDVYNYNYYDGDFQYYHHVNEDFIYGIYDGVEIVDRLTTEGSYGDEDWFVIFKYKDNFYKIGYHEGSQGMNYKVVEETFKQVHPKTKEVTIYE